MPTFSEGAGSSELPVDSGRTLEFGKGFCYTLLTSFLQLLQKLLL